MPTKHKLPSMQWYPGDWRKDIAIQSLSFHDRGVWFEMLMLMHDSEQRGILMLNGNAMTEEMIARAIGLDIQMFNQTLTNLLTTGVAQRDPKTNSVMNKRMVHDEEVRKIHAEAGKKGGNPVLVNQKKNQTPNQTANQNITPSSSSSSSKQEQKPSRVKREQKSDERHTLFKTAIGSYWEAKNPGVQMPWGPMEGKQLGMWLREAPHITLDQFTGFLRARFKSEVNHSDRPSQWIRWVTSYGSGPIDRFGKPIQEDGNGKTGKTNASAASERIDGARRVLAEIAIKRGLVNPLGGTGCVDEAVSIAGRGEIHRGIPEGFRAAGAAVLDGKGSTRPC